MASLRYRNNKWQVQVRRHGHTPQSKSFQSKADAQRWARHAEAELDRTLIPNDPRLLSTITITEVLTRYRDTIRAPIVGACQKPSALKCFYVQTGASCHWQRPVRRIRFSGGARTRIRHKKLWRPMYQMPDA